MRRLSQFKLDYTQEEATRVVLSGMRSLSLNGSVPVWPKCLACALTDNAFGGTKATRVADCQKCFDLFCWDGTDPKGNVDLSAVMGPGLKRAGHI